ncbi:MULTISPECIES: hypothetical protein [Clostridium]|uniref:hypothetical protein n=1 Tax=Clostridium TaxID=1485 RepID=UPI00069CEC50|nr:MULTISPECIES: hypothetical protein [Clostridium]KOF57847.1 hypothetical protein AGR56_16725 [Clostridium sp. DMHC 10]MCD2345076.1 hypothetical protein [Clostridium guangxiense]
MLSINQWLEKRVKKNILKAACVAINPVKAKHWKREWNRYKLSQKRRKLGKFRSRRSKND